MATEGLERSADEPPRASLLEPGSEVVLLGAPIAEIPSDLTPAEAELVANAVPSRVRELAAGRALVRRALAAMGRPPAEILASRDRAPIWPQGVSGSIAHTRDYCAVALGDARRVGQLGLDVEARGGVTEDLWDVTFVAEERAMLESLSGRARSDAATVLFCAKEAFYKAQYPRTGVILEFLDVTIRLADEGELTAEVRPARTALPRTSRGRFAVAQHRVWSLVQLSP